MKCPAIVAALAVALSFGGASLAEPPVAHGQIIALDSVDQASAEVLVLHATNDGKGIDPAIGDLPQLKQPPFSSYDSYKLLERGNLALAPSGELKLPDGGRLSLALQKAQPSDKKGETRYVIGAKVYKKNGDKFVSAEFNTRERVYFFVAGPPFENGILVLGIRVAPK
jgi:hypothetical protein